MGLLLEKISKYNFWDSRPHDLGLEREKYLDKLTSFEGTNAMVVITGARRSGKSTIVKQYIKKLSERGVPVQNVIFFSFFIRQLDVFKNEKTFFTCIDEWAENRISSEPSFVIIDEVQELENWDEVVASLVEDHTLNSKIIITGSNSTLLASEVSSKLSGRYYSLEVYPFDYREFCEISQMDPNSPGAFHRYVKSPSTPEPLLASNDETRNNLIEGIISSTVQKDIIERYNPSNPAMLSSIVDYARLNSSNYFTLTKIADTLNNQRKKRDSITHTTVEKYFSYLKAVYFVHQCEVYSYRKKDILNRANRKFYLNDTGMALFLQDFEHGRILENLVFMELTKSGYDVKTYLAYKNENLEGDFIATKNGTRKFIQVSWMLGDKNENSSLYRREFGNLESVKEEGEKILIFMEKKKTI